MSTSELELIKQHIGNMLKKNKVTLTSKLELNSIIPVSRTLLHERFESRESLLNNLHITHLIIKTM